MEGIPVRVYISIYLVYTNPIWAYLVYGNAGFYWPGPLVAYPGDKLMQTQPLAAAATAAGMCVGGMVWVLLVRGV